MTKDRIAELMKVAYTKAYSKEHLRRTLSECLDEIERLQRELEVLKQSRAAAVDQEQLSRNECNRLRALLAGKAY